MKLKRNCDAPMALALLMATSCSGTVQEPQPLVQRWAALASGSTEATMAIQSDWGAGYCAEITIKNNGSAALTGWTVGMDFRASNVTSFYSSKLNGSAFTPESYNRDVAPGGSVKFGFCAASSGSDYRAIIASFTTEGGGELIAGPTGNGAGGSGGETVASGSGGSTGSTSTGGSSGTNQSCAQLNGTSGWTSRFWDCCKPHCGWPGNANPALTSCGESNQTLASFDTQSACNGGGAFMCHGLTPWSVSDTLAYGYAATPTGSNSCGKCFAIRFTGSGHSGSDPGSAALAGKTMVVQAINIGGDVSQGQFDLMVPGGGVGAFNACSAQWRVSNNELGDQYGGLLSVCRRQLNYGGSVQDTQDCLRNKCNSLFTDARGLGTLRQGCLFYVDWMKAADNPNMVYREVTCPAALLNKSGLTQGGSTANACGS